MQPGGLVSRSVLVLAIAVMTLGPGSRTADAQPSSDFVPVTDEILQNPAPDDLLMWRRTLNSWGYSPLDQIDRENVNAIRMVWSRALGPGLQQGTPLVYDGVMLHAEPERCHSGDRRRGGRSQVGVSPRSPRRPALA